MKVDSILPAFSKGQKMSDAHDTILCGPSLDASSHVLWNQGMHNQTEGLPMIVPPSSTVTVFFFVFISSENSGFYISIKVNP